MNDEELEFLEADRILAEHRAKGLVAPQDHSGCYWGGEESDILYQDREVEILGIQIREAPYEMTSYMKAFSGKSRSSGGIIWQASVAFAEKVLSEPQRFAAGAVVELGCGCGVVSCALARQSSIEKFVITDMDWPVLDNAAHNVLKVLQPGGASAAFAALLEWESFVANKALGDVRAIGETSESAPTEFDLVVGCEIIWGDLGDLVSRVIVALGAPRFEIAAERGRDGVDDFVRIIEQFGFTVSSEALGEDAVLLSGSRL